MTPQIIAHRGASYLAPENTLIAFKKAMEIGADGVEMDVQQTIDAGLVIHHDYMIDLHTDISGKIYDMTMGDLKELDFGSWKDAIFQDEKIATLQEAMELCRQMPGCTVHLELKSTMDNDPDFVPRVLEVLRQTEMVEQVILVSFNHALLRQAKQLLPELRVGALVYGELESMLLPPPIIWKDLGLTNGMDDMEAMDAALPTTDADEENCSWMTRWMSDKVSMLRANFPGESLNEIYKNLMAQRDLPGYIRSLDFVPEWVSCEYHTAYKNAGFIDKLHEMGIKVSLWTVDTEDSVRSLLRTGADAYILKPFNMDILHRNIINLLTVRRTLRNKFTGNESQNHQVEQIEMQTPDNSLMQRVMEVINENINDSDLSVDMIAQKVGISRVHLHRKMKELTNQTPHSFIRNIRLQQAAKLLKDGKQSITEVMYACGFSNSASFSTMFKNLYGCSPREYMQNAMKK